MTPVNPSWGIYTLPMPAADHGFNVAQNRIGVSRRMADGTLVQDVTADKASITMRWEGLTAAEWSAFLTAYNANKDAGSQVFTLPDGASFTVLLVLQPRTGSPFYDAGGNPLYDITLAFEEV